MIHMERRELAHNRLRFYNIAITPTLFGGWALVREWGRIGQPGTVRKTWFETESAAIEAGEQVQRQKERRGYHLIAAGKNINSSTSSFIFSEI
jgi:predicted DNA-binding WGR domain protein